MTYLSLTQWNSAQFLWKSHFFSKFVQVGGRISSDGQDEDEWSGGRGIFKHKRQVWSLWFNKPLTKIFRHKILQKRKKTPGSRLSKLRPPLDYCFFFLTCIALVTLSARRHFRTRSFWKASRSVFHGSGKGSLQKYEAAQVIKIVLMRTWSWI